MTRPLATVLALLAAAVYVLMWVAHAQHWGWLYGFDWTPLNAAHEVGVKHPFWVRFWAVVSFVLGPVPVRVVGAVAVVVALAVRKVRLAVFLFACLLLSGVVTVVSKDLAGRPRPATALVFEDSTSFPSGHATEAMVAALAVLAVLLPRLGTRVGRAVAVVVAALCVLTVGVARVALNVHHPSDVLAGWALGYLYFLLCRWAIRPPLGRAPDVGVVTAR